MLTPNVEKSVNDSQERPAGRRYRQYRMYYDEDKSSLSLTKTIQAREHLSSWTITDANLSPDNTKMIWSTIGPVVGMTRVRDSPDDMETYDDGDGQVALDFGSGRNGGGRHFGVSAQWFRCTSRD
jgi:WD repeat-containing protein 23